MKTTITLVYDDGDAQAVAELTRGVDLTTLLRDARGVDLTTLLRDARGEFIARRLPAAKYVADRYGDDRYGTQSPDFAARKIREVEKRCKLAEVLKRGYVTILVEEES